METLLKMMHRWQSSFSSLGRLAWLPVALVLITPLPAQTLHDKVFAEVEKLPHPKSAADFHAAPALGCLNQGKTSICWSFATSSFVESEMARLKLEPVRLSVLYPLYCAYLEKTRLFVQTRGESRYAPGDLFTGVPELWQRYGALPASIYDHITNGRTLDHDKLYAELDALTQEIKREGRWNEAKALSRVTKILNQYLGEPPKKFEFNGKTYTPLTFLNQVVRLPWSEYIMATSFEYAPFNTFTTLDVPDNWRRNTNFFNVPLPVYYDAFKDAVRSGYTVAVSVDTSEPAYKITGRHCFIPNFDIAPAKIDQTAREMRFTDGATTDDHAIHIIGWNNFDGEDWFLAKDSWKTAWQHGSKGDLFLHSSYVKLKVLAFIVHRDGVPQITALMPHR